MDVRALLLSFEVAATTTVVLLVIAAPLGYWIAFSGRKWKGLVEAIVALPLVLPPTVLGFYLLLALGPRGPVGAVFESLFDVRLVFTFQGLVIASVLYSLPFMVQPVATAFASVDRRLIEVSKTLGSSTLDTFFRVVVPLSRAGIVTGAVLSFAHTLGEFGVALMVGGNIPGVTRVASISIYEDVQTLDYTRAGWTSLVLIAVSFVVLVLTYSLQRRRSVGSWPVR